MRSNPEINVILEQMKESLHVIDFVEPTKTQRNFGSHLIRLKDRIGVREFWYRFNVLFQDNWHRPKMNRLKYIYDYIKSFVPDPTQERFKMADMVFRATRTLPNESVEERGARLTEHGLLPLSRLSENVCVFGMEPSEVWDDYVNDMDFKLKLEDLIITHKLEEVKSPITDQLYGI